MATKEYSKSQITVRTKDELANAIKKGYGKILILFKQLFTWKNIS